MKISISLVRRNGNPIEDIISYDLQDYEHDVPREPSEWIPSDILALKKIQETATTSKFQERTLNMWKKAFITQL